ncbi:TPA: DNA modification methylase [Pseudomonas aeruginosa]|uniref:DNA methyltransferase n=1 Tax=Pseudomonas aeruginosa TaxID=287 RepID=UPI00208FCAD8|nr:site-specific DNA-methyltransferase [Pseudomonas aeruginosa]HCK4355018.1 DNA modification methylase [Pseudomonas aeruginosa]HDY5318483.1 DNA modification methylase [Pseudomonas aeruginosa]HEH8645839.1 DNA modification methylase [Pseudomonas aeruginosa]HEK1214091.1 DNA modification methylase [Pseudomonas aeruginosa]
MPRSLAYERDNALNAICPYFTMFPLEYPLGVLKQYRKENPVVMDPFCGRGTTLFAARKLGLAARGIDSSPIAVAIARAKLATVDTAKALELAKLYMEMHEQAAVPDNSFFQAAFHPNVLRKVCAIRAGLLRERRDSDTTVILRAAMLGCLHGPTSKTPERRSYFSNQMPRTFSSKPDYSVRYWKNKQLIAPDVDVLKVLERKLTRLDSAQLPHVGVLTNVRKGDSRMAASLPTACRDFSVVVTSPPYYGMRTYVEDQWLRNWFLGGPDHVVYGKSTQLQHAGFESFAESLGKVWKNMARTIAEDLDMHIRFGIIPSSKVDAKALVRASLEASGVRWDEISVRSAKSAASGKRQADHMAAGSAAAREYDFHVRRS